jgi:cysteine synthase A
MILPTVLEGVGNTPLVVVDIKELSHVNLFAKLEAFNPTGSVKDRAASYILKMLLKSGQINRETVILESTSGNFGVALSAYCRHYGLSFIAVTDPHLTTMNELLIRSYGAQLIKVTEPDEYGGYLLNRIRKIKQLQEGMDNCYWVNQYENPLNANAYYHSLGKEICYQVDEIDYVFLGISSGGTITGVSQKVKENFPHARIVAVDVEGSVIFGQPPQKRFIPGIGSSMVPKILESARIDDVVIVDEITTIQACHDLLAQNNLFMGGSSGSVLAGIKKYFENKEVKGKVNVVTIFADRGERYYNTIFNPEWVQKLTLLKRKECQAASLLA